MGVGVGIGVGVGVGVGAGVVRQSVPRNSSSSPPLGRVVTVRVAEYGP